jgi:hypothetical protein
VDDAERATPIDFGVTWDQIAPNPLLIQDESDVFLLPESAR